MSLRLTDDQTLSLVLYLIGEDYDQGIAFASSLAGEDVDAMDDEGNINEWLYKAVDYAQAARNMEYMPAEKPGKIRLFHSILQMGDMTIGEKIAQVLTEGLKLEYSRKYKSQFGEFAGIWTQTDGPYNKNVIWFAFDVPESKIDPYDLRDFKDPRRTQPTQIVYQYDVGPSQIVAVQGVPASKVKKALQG